MRLDVTARQIDTKWSRGRKAVPGKGGCPVDAVEFKCQAGVIVLSPTGPGRVLKDLDVRSCGQAGARHK